MKKIKFLSALFAIGILTTGCGSTSDKNTENGGGSDKVIKIGYVDLGRAFPNDVFAIALEKGYLEEELDKVDYELEAVPFTGAGPAINEAMAGNSIDMATSGDVPVAIAKSNGIDTTLIAAEVGFNEAALVVPEDSTITSIHDLKGKKIAALKGGFMHKSFLGMLEANQLTINDIEFVNMTSQDAEAALISNSIEAGVLAGMQVADIMNKGEGKVILSGADNPEWKGSHGIVVRTEYAKANKEAVTAVLQAFIRANDFAKEHREETVQILQKAGYPAETLDLLFPEEVDFNLVGGDEAKKAFEDIGAFLETNALITQKLDVNAWYDDSFNEAARKSLSN